MGNKKLIEVALPLEKINEAAAYEKMPGIGSHPRGIHLWWARRPFTVARAVLWSSIIDDPSSHPELYPTESAQNEERARLFRILEELSDWKNSFSKEVFIKAKKEIERSTGGAIPTVLDPFAGGGAIPSEAQRLGLNAYAHDLNPVAVMLNKAMLEIPPKFVGLPAVNPASRETILGNTVAVGHQNLSDDIAYYGHKVFRKAHAVSKFPVILEKGFPSA